MTVRFSVCTVWLSIIQTTQSISSREKQFCKNKKVAQEAIVECFTLKDHRPEPIKMPE